jgi:hypothetical protein
MSYRIILYGSRTRRASYGVCMEVTFQSSQPSTYEAHTNAREKGLGTAPPRKSSISKSASEASLRKKNTTRVISAFPSTKRYESASEASPVDLGTYPPGTLDSHHPSERSESLQKTNRTNPSTVWK